jgi:hypothetical protein
LRSRVCQTPPVLYSDSSYIEEEHQYVDEICNLSTGLGCHELGGSPDGIVDGSKFVFGRPLIFVSCDGLPLGSAVDVFQSIFFGLREDGFQGFFGVSMVA